MSLPIGTAPNLLLSSRNYYKLLDANVSANRRTKERRGGIYAKVCALSLTNRTRHGRTTSLIYRKRKWALRASFG